MQKKVFPIAHICTGAHSLKLALAFIKCKHSSYDKCNVSLHRSVLQHRHDREKKCVFCDANKILYAELLLLLLLLDCGVFGEGIAIATNRQRSAVVNNIRKRENLAVIPIAILAVAHFQWKSIEWQKEKIEEQKKKNWRISFHFNGCLDFLLLQDFDSPFSSKIVRIH